MIGPAPTARESAAAVAVHAIRAEAVKGILLILGYRFNNVAFLATFVFVFVGIGFFMGNGRLDPIGMQSPLLGYLVWFFGMKAVDHMAFMLAEEARSGTLEQMYMTPTPMGLVMLGRSLGMLAVAAVQAAIVAGAIALIIRLPVTFDPPIIAASIPIFALTILGLFGFGYVVAGLTIVFKQIGTVVNMLQNLLLFFSGALLPVDRLPPTLAAVARTLPSTQGIVVLREVVFARRSLADVWADGSLPWLVAHSLLYFVLGWLFYARCEAIAKRQGTLGQY
jgi:ABC-2 type transport system permease protein